MSAPNDQNLSHRPPGEDRQDSAEVSGGPVGEAGSRSRGPGELGESTLWDDTPGAPRREDIRLTPRTHSGHCADVCLADGVDDLDLEPVLAQMLGPGGQHPGVPYEQATTAGGRTAGIIRPRS